MLRALFATCCLSLLYGFVAPPIAAAANEPEWIVARPGATARVDIAPWSTADEPEAALTESASSIARDFTADGERPGDIRYEPVGVTVRIERLMPGARIALVHGLQTRWQAYARVERLVPVVPPGTSLVAAGTFAGFADFYPALDTAQIHAGRLATGTRLVALATGVAPYDANSSDLVRLHVRVIDGPLRGQSGWVAVAYTGLRINRLARDADVAEHACNCRLIQFLPARS